MAVYEILDYEYSGEYEYDFNFSHSTFHWEELLPTLIVYGVTLVLGVTGNSLIVFATYRYRRMQSATNMLLSSLASADLLLIIFCIPVKVAKLFSYTWAMGAFLCKAVYYMQNVSAICSVLTLTAISIERYYAIVHPMKAKYTCTISQAKKIIAITWCLAFLLSIPILFVQIQMPVGDRFKGFWCSRDWDSQILWKFHEVYMLILVLIGPTFIMSTAYALICWEICKVMERRHVMTSRNALYRNNVDHENEVECIGLTDSGKVKNRVKVDKDDTQVVRQVIYMLVAVVILFIICWAPLLIDNLLTAFNILPKQRTGSWKHVATTVHLMAYFNSCINPIVYGFMSKNFRESFQIALCCSSNQGSGQKNEISSFRQTSPTISNTRTTSFK